MKFILALCFFLLFNISICQNTCTQVNYNTNCTTLTGGISLKNDSRVIANFSSLISVNGDINFYNNNNLSYIDMENLESLVGSLVIQSHGSLSDINFRSLQSLTGELNIDSNGAMTSFDFPSLISIGDDLRITSISALAYVYFPALSTIGNNLVISNNPILQYVQFCSLSNITKNLNISGNPVSLCCDPLIAVTFGSFDFPNCDNSSSCTSDGINISPSIVSLASSTGKFNMTMHNKPQENGYFNVSISQNNIIIARPANIQFTPTDFNNLRQISVFAVCPKNSYTIPQNESAVISLTSLQYCTIKVPVNIFSGVSCLSNITSSTFNGNSQSNTHVKSSTCINTVNSSILIVLLIAFILNWLTL